MTPFRLIRVAAMTALVLSASPGLSQKGDKSENAAPPTGWKQHSPDDGAYVVWVPEKVAKTTERARTGNVKGATFKVNILIVETADGPTLVVEEIQLGNALARQVNKADLEIFFRDFEEEDSGGKIKEETLVKMNAPLVGVPNGIASGKEYFIEGASVTGRVRIFVTPFRALVLRATGTKEQVNGVVAKTFLASGRLNPKIVGGSGDPVFTDTSLEGGLLVGVEVGTGKRGNADVVKAVRPIFRTGDKETPGEQHGADLSKVVRLIAKPGYVVGQITVKSGAVVDGFSITFMKATNGRLNPKDSYESEWVGGKGSGAQAKLGGDTPVVGVIGKANATTRDVTGLGLVYRSVGK